MTTLTSDLRFAVRTLLKRPGFTLVMVLTLVLGIGANTAIFSITDKLLRRSLAVKNPEQLFQITSVSVSPHFVSNAFSYSVFKDYRNQNRVLADITAFNRTELQLKTDQGSQRVNSEYVGGNYFDFLGVAAAQGRTFAPDEDSTPGAQPVVVISENFRRRKFFDENP